MRSAVRAAFEVFFFLIRWWTHACQSPENREWISLLFPPGPLDTEGFIPTTEFFIGLVQDCVLDRGKKSKDENVDTPNRGRNNAIANLMPYATLFA